MRSRISHGFARALGRRGADPRRGEALGRLDGHDSRRRAMGRERRDPYRRVHRAGGDRDRQCRVASRDRGALADEQAALRRVATLVAPGAPPEDIFAAAVNEVAGLLPVVSATMGRFEPADTVTTVASWSTSEAAFPTGVRWPTGEERRVDRAPDGPVRSCRRLLGCDRSDRRRRTGGGLSSRRLEARSSSRAISGGS